MFELKNTNAGIVYYSDLIPDVEHFFTTRESNVDDNFEKICEYLNTPPKSFIHPNQTHSSNIEFVQKDIKEYPDTDALILTNSSSAVYLRFADCTPIILYDKKYNIGAVVHAGWRGTVACILPKTLKKMVDFSGSDMKNIFVIIGPAIGGCCYSVGEEVVLGVKHSVNNSADLIYNKDGQTFVDLKLINSRQALEFGIYPEHIDICPFCTCCNNDLFFSYRKENGTSNRHNAVLKLK